MRYPLNTVPINGNQTLYGSGAAGISITASGFSAKQKYGVSTAALTDFNASGALKKAAAGASAVSIITLDADGIIRRGLPGASTVAVLDIDAKYGIPSPKIIASPSGPTHPSRELRIPADGRIVDISPEGEF